MKRLVGSITVSLVLAAAAAAGAQERKGFVQGSGGFATNSEATSGDVALQGGVRVAPHLVVFGRMLVGEIGYAFSRIATDTPVTANSVTFGVGVRF